MGACLHINLRSPQIKDSTPNTEVTIEQRIEKLEKELADWQQKDFLNQSIIGEYRQALADAQLSLATANAQLKLAQRQMEA